MEKYIDCGCNTFGACEDCGTTCKHWPCTCVEESQERHDETLRRSVKALDVQEGGNHYKTKSIQPIEYIFANGIGFAEGNVIKYVSRWKDKGGIEDLKKARHYLDLLIEAHE